jgi:hypothetical protein
MPGAYPVVDHLKGTLPIKTPTSLTNIIGWKDLTGIHTLADNEHSLSTDVKSFIVLDLDCMKPS